MHSLMNSVFILFYYFINIPLSKYMIERFKLGHNVDRNRQDKTRLGRAL